MNTKKKLLVISVVISIIAILSLGTIAWFTDIDEVENDFMIAQSGVTEEEIFNLDLYELRDTNGDGNGDERTEIGFDYSGSAVAPGANFVKEVYVDNTGTYDQYVRLFVTLSDVSAWLDVLDITSVNDYVKLEDIFEVEADFDTTWYRNDAETQYDTTANTLTYVYYYNGILKANDAPLKFMDSVTVPDTLEMSHVVAMDGAFDIDFKAEAVQTTSVLSSYGAVEYQNAIDSFDVCIDNP